MPGRYARAEISGGYLESVDSYAYRMPNAPAWSENSTEVAAQVAE
jgi:hypothetical protein